MRQEKINSNRFWIDQAALAAPVIFLTCRGKNCDICWTGTGRLNEYPCILCSLTCEALKLLLRFNTFSRCRDISRLSNPYDRTHDCKRAVLFCNIFDEGTINFDFVEWKTLQITQ